MYEQPTLKKQHQNVEHAVKSVFRKVRLENIDQAKAFMWYLAKERKRHLKDADNCLNDMLSLHKEWGILMPDPDDELWVVPEKY